MELNQYTYMFESEDRHWWYVGNHEHFLALLKSKNILRPGLRVLDAGCGTGKWLEILKKKAQINETGIDFQEVAIEYARTRGDMNLMQGDVNKKMFEQDSFDLITCFDVLCNAKVDDRKALENFNSYLSENGHLLLTLPAYKFMLSTHDKAVHTGKRYTRKQVKYLLKEAGFESVRSTYTVSLLFSLAFLKRIFDKLSHKDPLEHNEVKIPHPIINTLFLAVMRIENFILSLIPLPFGLSVVVLAKKKTNETH